MAVDVKVVRICLWRFSVLCAGICFRFAQKHPCISGTLSSLLFLYIFFPMLFKLLIYSSPIMVWVYAYRKKIIKSEHPEARIQEEDTQVNDSKSQWVKIDGNVLAKKKFVNFSMQNGRRPARAKNKESADYVPELQHKTLGTPLNAEVSEDAQGQADDHLKTALRKLESDILGKAENDLKIAKGESESDIFVKDAPVEETQAKNELEETQNTVQQIAQDERNSMDLGTSETERDKRLEGLIQNRRARKLLSMQVRNVIDIIRHPQNQVAPLVIARGVGPHALINTLSDTGDLHMPGSAPSVLLPTRSPFDLPYDPFEERPDLTGDSSFQQEFITPDQKDSYGLEGFSLGSGLDRNSFNALVNKENKGMKRHGFSRFRSYRERGSYETLSPGASSGEYDLLSHDNLAVRDSRYEEQTSYQPLKSDNVTTGDSAKSEDTKASVNFIEENKDKCHLESLGVGNWQVNGTEGHVEVDSINSNQVDGAKVDSIRNLFSEDLSSYLHKSLASSLQENSDKDAKENGHAGSPVYISSLFNVHKRILHTPAHSIASDLVVEISEAGSPPPTLSPPDDSQGDADVVDRDLSSGSEGISMHVYRTEDNEMIPESGMDCLAQGETIPEAEVLEQDVVDEHKHANQTSSDDDSSYENVARHLIEKLKARCRNKGKTPDSNALDSHPVQHETGELSLSGPGSAESSAITSENHFEPGSGLDSTSGSRDTRELRIDSIKQDNGSVVEEAVLPLVGQGSGNMQTSEDEHGGNNIRSSGDVAMPTAQQAQAFEGRQEETSSKSVLLSTYSSDQITTLETRPSDLRSSPPERNVVEATKQVTESEGTSNSSPSDD